MRRAEQVWVTFAAMLIVTLVGGCSRTDRTNTAVPEESATRTGGAVGTGGAGANLKDNDDFVRDVALKNLAEIELSRMALDKATNPNIKAFAQMMLDDHGAAANTLKSVASGHGFEWPTQLDEKHRKTAGELAMQQGADFDRDYVEAMVEGHQDLAAKLESRLDVQSVADWKTAAAGRTQDKALPEPNAAMRDVAVRPDKGGDAVTTQINQWAADTYPVVQKHLDTARTLENTTKRRSTD